MVKRKKKPRKICTSHWNKKSFKESKTKIFSKSCSSTNDSFFQTLISNSDFCVEISNVASKGWTYVLKSYKFSVDNLTSLKESLPETSIFWIYLSLTLESNFIYIKKKGETEEKLETQIFMIQNLSFEDIESLKTFNNKDFKKKKSNLNIHLWGFENNCISVEVVICEDKLCQLSHYSDVPWETSESLRQFLNSSLISKSEQESIEHKELSFSKFELDLLYCEVQKYHKSHKCSETSFSDLFVQHQSLKPQLRPYQRNAVRWMLQREKGLGDFKEKMNPLFLSVLLTHCSDGLSREVYYNPYGGFITDIKQCISEICTGGILADEMGLGKTVEVLSLILCNPRENVPKPPWKDPVVIPPTNRKRRRFRRQRRSPSPVEFTISQIDGNSLSETEDKIYYESSTSNESESSNSDYVPTSSSKKSNRPTYKRLLRPTSKKSLAKTSEGPSSKRSVAPTSSEDYEGKTTEEKTKKEETIQYKVKKEKLYDKMKCLYESQLAEYTTVSQETKRKNNNGNYFETKVKRQTLFECFCGAEDNNSENENFNKVQCTDCTVIQHADCVKYDVTNPFRGDYYCPHCWTLQEPIPSRATLIVSPNSISYQWISEITRHIVNQNFKILFYEGTKSSGYIQPRTLANYDIVITTYAILKSETNYVDIPHSNSSEGRRFRNAKRFMASSAPLPSIQWWRICLDEAQMIECSTTKTAEMALRLKAVHRWCVTGTPIGKSMNDLYGLLLFLQYEPFNRVFWWKSAILNPYLLNGNSSPLLDLLKSILWRNSKKDVLSQINIPSSSSVSHWLRFSPIEEHFYRRQHIECSSAAVAQLKKFPDLNCKLSSLDRQQLSHLLNPLLKLRQCCSHPQAVKGQFVSHNKVRLSMEELLEFLIKKAITESEDHHRIIISALNGLAALDMIESDWVGAATNYRLALSIVDTYKENIKTDSLQILHTITNLNELLTSGHPNVGQTLRDASLMKEAETLRTKYLSKYNTALSAAKESAWALMSKVDSFPIKLRPEVWYVQIINGIQSGGSEESFMKVIHDEMSQFYDVVNHREFRQIQEKYPNSRSLLLELIKSNEELESKRCQIAKMLRQSTQKNPTSHLSKAGDCHLKQRIEISSKKKSKKLCELCTLQRDLEIYEGLLFHFIKGGEIKGINESRESLSKADSSKLEEAGVILYQDQRKGTWADSKSERLLKAILKYGKTQFRTENESLIEDGTSHLSYLEAMKKEFKGFRNLLRHLYDTVAGMDELNMSIIRLRLRYDDEPVSETSTGKNSKKTKNTLATREKDKYENIYILEAFDLPSHRLKLLSEKTTSSNEFKKKYGQLLYLQNLKASDFIKTNGMNPEPCPICQKSLGRQWSVLQCGHCFCVECIQILMDDYSSKENGNKVLKCAICRNATYTAEISTVNTAKDEEEKDSLNGEEFLEENIKGSLSTKIEAVIKAISKIHRTHENDKILIFSNWTDVLEILEFALLENSIQFATLVVGKKFKRNLQKFKNREDVKVLLLPISSGANGLNLIEANHVFLIEPILNPAIESQAIGRIQRIGQMKHTVVHRFYIRSTIEERIHSMLRYVRHKTIHFFTERELMTRSHQYSQSLQKIELEREMRMRRSEDEKSLETTERICKRMKRPLSLKVLFEELNTCSAHTSKTRHEQLFYLSDIHRAEMRMSP